MSRKKRMQSLAEAKDRRMKKIAVGGAVLLVVVLAFEVPKMLHSGGSSSSTPPAATTTDTTAAATGTPATGTPATGAPATGTAAALPAASTKLPNSDLQPRRTKSTLVTFNLFAGKDPFAQQISAAPATGGATAGSTSPSGHSGGGSSSSGPSAAGSKQSSSRTLAATGAAKISVNGRIETVRVGARFPSANPLFRLVGMSNGIARIGIANGSYTSGTHTISLTPGRTLTLVDTSDSVRYKIRLLNAS
jgi:hypothetical protein